MSDYQFIHGGLAQGAYPKPLKKHFETFDTIVFCAEELQPSVRGLKSGKEAVYCPMDDNFYAPIQYHEHMTLLQLSQQLAQRVASGKKVLVTCAQGVNRSGLVTGLTLMHLTGCSGEEAIATVRKNRTPNHDFMVLGNPMFEQCLLATPRQRRV